jgi:monoamine oxidase
MNASGNRTVTVIGAGLAGLSAAYDLHRAGWRVTVLEARDRVGGRVHSVRSFSNGLVAEAGGEFIEESHTRMIALANHFGLQLGIAGSWQKQAEDWASFDGKSGRMSDINVWGTNLAEEIERGWRALSALGQYVPDPYQPQAARDAERLDAQSALDWINALDVSPFAKKFFIQYIRSEYTTEPRRFSLLDLARNAAMYYRAVERPPSLRVIGGNDQIPRALAAALPDVRLNSAVTSICILPDEVFVTAKQNNSYLMLRSAFVILAIPLTTARSIDFNSSLPAAHRRMVDEISYGAVTKVMIEYRKRFWNDAGWNGRMATDGPIVFTWDATSHIEHERGILTAYTGGRPGAKLSSLSDGERTRLAAAEIEKLFPASSDLIENTATIAWLNEPYTRGSYMALAPGEVTAHWRALLEPAGRLFFAGEHATAIQGFMEGAVESGQRAAATILAHGG